MEKTRKLYGLQYLRAIAAIAVVAFHAAGRVGGSFLVGEAGVDIFFVLSGFIMVAITGPTTRPGSFLADRIRRILPPYWIVTTLIVVGTFAGLFPHIVLKPGYVAASFLFLPSVVPGNVQIWPLLVPGWTLNFEMMFYVVFALSISMRSQRAQMAVMTIGFAVLVAVGMTVDMPGTALRFYADPLLLEFAAGGWLAIAWKRFDRWPTVLALPSVLVGVAGFVAATLVEPPIPRVLLYGVPAVILVTGVLGIERSRPMRRWSVPLLLGDASYSIYLWHTLIIAAALRLLIGPLSAIPPIGAILLLVPIGTAGGIAGHLLIERPILRYLHERRYRRGVPIPAGP